MHEAGERGEVVLLDRFAAGDDQRTGAVADARRVAGRVGALVLLSLIFGIACRAADSRRVEIVLNLVDGLLAVSMKIVKWAMFLTPYAVFGLTAQLIARVGIATVLGMAAYVLSVVVGLLGLLLVPLLTLLLVQWLVFGALAGTLDILLATLVLLYFAHNDLWWWHDDRIVLGLPIGLLYHVVYCLVVALLMGLLVSGSSNPRFDRNPNNGEDFMSGPSPAVAVTRPTLAGTPASSA